MAFNRPKQLVSDSLKHYEEQIVYFYQIVGDMIAQNSKGTRIFAYLQIYGLLTQKQLKELTKFSSSTISSILNAFIQTGIVTREISENTRVGLYRLKTEKVSFQYVEFTKIMKELELIDRIIDSFQQKIKNDGKVHPKQAEFLQLRTNSYRNYVEAQRRAINQIQKYTYFDENVSNLGYGDEIINFPPVLEKLIHEIVSFLVENSFPSQDDPISNLIFAHFCIRKFLTQELLVQITNLSLSTISRYLKRAVENDFIIALPKQYKTSRIYQLPSLSLYITKLILDTDAFIFSWKAKFQEMLEELYTSKLEFTESFNLIKLKLEHLITQISESENGSKLLANARVELLENFASRKEEI